MFKKLFNYFRSKWKEAERDVIRKELKKKLRTPEQIEALQDKARKAMEEKIKVEKYQDAHGTSVAEQIQQRIQKKKNATQSIVKDTKSIYKEK